jgi:subtilisin family serine protease
VISRRLPASAAGPGRTLILVSSATQTTGQLAARFTADPSVAGVSPNYLRYVDALPPDDPGLALQWGLEDVRAGDVWPITTGSGDVVVASVDTGVDVLHPDLAANMWHNPGEVPGNGVDDDGNGYVDDVYGIDAAYDDSVPMDDYGHGTHTSGIAAAAGDNALGVAGLGWSTKIMALKFINYEGGGTDADAIECIDYAVREKLEHGVNVVAINASWGGGAANPFLRRAINAAGEAGIVFVASAGNDAEDNDRSPHYPSSLDCPTLVSVAATAPDGRLAYFSNWGRVSVDLAAPGEDILSAMPDGRYERWSGTSMAAPFVTGAVALCAARYPGETAEQRIDRVLGSLRTGDYLSRKVLAGGTLDAAAALGLGAAAGDVAPPVTTALSDADAVNDIPVPVALFATDGAGGSGVATTEWRLDGGAWRTGTRAVVPAPVATRRTRVLEYRSTDRAGNTEAAQQLSVVIDTTRRAADGRAPGVPLPPSPVTGGLDVRHDDSDLYRLRLDKGESIRLSADGPAPGAVGVELVVAPQTKALSGGTWFPSEQASVSLVAPRAGLYYLAVLYWDWWGGVPLRYRFSYEILPAGTDTVPPEVRMTGYTSRWRNQPLTVAILADDGPGGSGVTRIETSRDDGLTWTEGASILVEAPADHSNDGHHFIRFRAVDVAGNVSPYDVRDVRIDTRGPSTQAWGPERAVRRGSRATVEFRVEDLAQWVRGCRLQIRTADTGRLVLVKRLGSRLTADTIWWDSEHRYRTSVTCRWPAGAYTVRICGTTSDPAGNRVETATCERLLVVK